MSLPPADPIIADASAAPKHAHAEEARGRFIPIGVKFAVLSVAVIGIAAAVAFFQATARERARLIEAKRVAASMVADLLAQSLEAPLDFSDEEALQKELDHLRQNKDVVYAGVWRKDERAPWLELRSPGPRFELPSALDVATSVAFADRVETVRPVIGRSGKVLGSAVIQFSLERENAELARNQYQLPRAQIRRLLGGAAIVVVAWFDVIASWAHPDGEPPQFGIEAGVLCAIGGLIGAALIGFFGPHRKLALGALGATGLLLVRKPYAAPVISDWMGERHAFSMSSETHFYFLIPGILALALTVILTFATRATKKS